MNLCGDREVEILKDFTVCLGYVVVELLEYLIYVPSLCMYRWVCDVGSIRVCV